MSRHQTTGQRSATAAIDMSPAVPAPLQTKFVTAQFFMLGQRSRKMTPPLIRDFCE
jgi:hypothetical protein